MTLAAFCAALDNSAFINVKVGTDIVLTFVSTGYQKVDADLQAATVDKITVEAGGKIAFTLECTTTP